MMTRTRIVAAGIVIAAAVAGIWLVPWALRSAEPERPTSRPEFRPKVLMTPRRAIVNAPLLAADKVGDRLEDNELVIGVVVEGQARAYPINMLTGPSREIINDTLAGVAIAATW